MSSTKRETNLATAGLAAAAVLVFGATAAFAATTKTPPGPATTKTKPSDQFSDPDGTYGGILPGGTKFGQGPHGDETLRDATGQWVEEIWQTGKVVSVSGDELTVIDQSGLTWHWTVSPTAKVTADGAPATISAIRIGDIVSLTGTQTETVHTAATISDAGPARRK